MKRLLVTMLIALALVPALRAEEAIAAVDTTQAGIGEIDPIESSAVPFDTTRDSGYWWRALKHLKLDVNDTTIEYPGIIDLGLKIYRWGDRTFNSYDTAYVVGASHKKFKLMLKNNNFYDGYSGHLTKQRLPFRMNSNMRSSFGFYAGYMALSVGYMLSINSLLNDEKVHTRRLDFSFNCSRISFDFYYLKDDAEANLHKLGKYHHFGFKDVYKFHGLKREYYGVYANYFFNHLHYAQPAAYSFSKIQKKSAGSFVVGLHGTHQDIIIDFSALDDAPSTIEREMTNVLPDTMRVFRFRHRELSLLFGYGYSWVFHHHWLFNCTFTPGIGYIHTFPNSVDGKRNSIGFNYRLKMALVRYAGNWFYGLHFFVTGHWYLSHNHSLYNDLGDLNATVGFRF